MDCEYIGLPFCLAKKGHVKIFKQSLEQHPAVVWWVICKEKNTRIFEDKDNILNLKHKYIILLLV